MTSYRTLFLSDLHLGMRGAQAGRVLDFVRHHSARRWVLVGDARAATDALTATASGDGAALGHRLAVGARAARVGLPPAPR